MLLTTQILAATEEADGGLNLLPDFAELLWGAVAFLLLFAVLKKFAFPKMNATLEERSALIQGRMEEAEQARAEAAAVQARYEEQVADARGQANAIVEEAKAQAERVRAEILAKAEEEAAQIRARAQQDLEAERGRLVQDLRSQVATLSVDLAGKIVQRELSADQHRALVDAYIDDLSGLN